MIIVAVVFVAAPTTTLAVVIAVCRCYIHSCSFEAFYAGVVASLHQPFPSIIVFLATRHVAGRVALQLRSPEAEHGPQVLSLSRFSGLARVSFNILVVYPCCVTHLAGLYSKEISYSSTGTGYWITVEFCVLLHQ